MKKFFSTVALITLWCASYGAEVKRSEDPLTFAKGNTSVKIGGFVTLTMGSYIEGATTSGNDFPVNLINMNPSQTDEHRLVLDPTSTRLYIDASQKSETLGDVRLYVEGDFRGSGNTLFLRVATIEMKGFTIGQTWSLMTDAKSIAPTIDISGANSRTFFRTQMVAYRHKFNKGANLGVSLEYPTIKYTSSSTQPDIRIPDAVAYLDKSGDLGYIKVAGVWRTIQYSYEDGVETTNGWGIRLSGSLNMTDRLTLSSQGVYGKSICKFINDFTTQGYDIIEDSDGTIYDKTPMYGIMGSAKYKFSDKLSLGANYSKAYVDIDDSYSAVADTYKSGQYISTTLFYYPVKNLILGMEYLNGHRKNFDGAFERSQRVNTMVRYLF